MKFFSKNKLKKQKKDRKKKNDTIKGFKFIEVVVIVIITGIVCSLATGMIFYHHSSTITYEKLSDNDNVNKFLQVYASLITEYYEEIDEEELVDEAINAMFDYLGDDYSEELSEAETESLLEQLSGEYDGIGVEITGQRIIYTVFEGSPAEAAGLEKNDQIIMVNDEDMSSQDNSYVASYIKSCEDDTLNITVLRGEEQLSFEVTKDHLYIPSISKDIVEENGKKIGYIYISTFSNTTATQLQTALESLESEGIESLIIDVRNNSGGYLSVAKEIASMFLENGKVIYSLESKTQTTEYKDTTDESRSYDIVVLVNEYSASASEILASALKESYGATLVGKTTYGKGKVQQTLTLSDGSMAKYTTAKWLTPNGDCIDGVGVSVDYDIDLEIDEDNQTIIDTQLNKAIELLSN